MDAMKRLANCGIVPVVVLEDAKDAVPTADALLAGGVDVMEITFRTDAAAEAIKAVSEKRPDMLVGAGTVITLEQCRRAVAMGAKFIVAPGFDEEVVRWCIDNGVAVTPGCVTPTEIMAAMKLGIRVIKFFPASVFGGLSAMKALSAPFGGIRFIPTGGVNNGNIGDFIATPFIHAVGGSWVCAKKDIAEGNFSRITELCKSARAGAMGIELTHADLNCENADRTMELNGMLRTVFSGSAGEDGGSVNADTLVETLKSFYPGVKGHIRLKTNSVELVAAELRKKAFTLNEDTAEYKGGRMNAAYLNDEFGGFTVQLVQK